MGALLADGPAALPATLPPRWTADARDVADLLRAFDPGAAEEEVDAVAEAAGPRGRRVPTLAPGQQQQAHLPARLTARISDASVLLACLLEASSGDGEGGGGGGRGAVLAPSPRRRGVHRATTAFLPDDDGDDDGPLPLPSVFGVGAGRRPVDVPGVAGAAAARGPAQPASSAAAARAAAIVRQRAKRQAEGGGPPPAGAVSPPAAAAPAARRPPKRARVAPADVDAAFATAPIEEAALALPPGLTEAERRKELRKAKNRASALASRLRREGHAAALEARVAELERYVRLLEGAAAAPAARDARRAVAADAARRGGVAALGTRRSTRVVGGLGARHVTM